jgi:hypothetical protein
MFPARGYVQLRGNLPPTGGRGRLHVGLSESIMCWNDQKPMECAMADQRLNLRLKHEWQCNVHLANSSYYAMTKNISSSGVLVHFLDPLPDVHVGDKCILSLNRGLLLRYDSEVARVEASNIAFRLLSAAM